MLTRHKPLSRTPMQRKQPERPAAPDRGAEFASHTPSISRAVMARSSDRCRVMPKSAPVEHEGYRRLVAAMPCDFCRKPGPSQCAHADQNKGMGTKTDDRTCFPLCADTPGQKGCHTLIGASAFMSKLARRGYEELAGRRTRADIRRRGLWPVGLAEWPEDAD